MSLCLQNFEVACFTKGQRGCTLLTHQGFNFVKNRKSKFRTYWICARKDRTGCKARVVSRTDEQGVERIILRTTEHNHPIHLPPRTALNDGYFKAHLI